MNKFQEISWETGALRKVYKRGEAIVRQGYPLGEPRLVFGRKKFNFGMGVSSSAATIQ